VFNLNILLKFIIRNILEKKLRTLLIVFSVALSSALFFATSSISDSFQNMYEESIRNEIGTADIYLRGETESPLINREELELDESQYKTVVDIIELRGIYGDDEEPINIRAAELEDLEDINRIDFLERRFENELDDNEIIISSRTAESENLEINDKIDMEINGEKQSFEIAGIADTTRFFTDELNFRKAIISLKRAQAILRAENVVNLIYLDIEDNLNKANVLEKLEDENENIVAEETISDEELETLRNSISTPFYMILSVVLIMSVFIIYSAFKVIVLERMGNIGTFRSVGATKFETTFILVLESLLYGIIGAIMGIALGIGILDIMVRVLGSIQNTTTDTDIVFTMFQLVASALLGIIVSILSSLLPILKINKFPIKEIVLDFHKDEGREGNKKLFIGLALMTISLLVQLLLPETDMLVLALSVIILFIIGSIMITPYLVKLFTSLTKQVWYKLLGNESIIALKNINTKVLSNNIALFIIGISVVLAITSVTKSVENFIVGVYDEMEYDMRVQNIADYDEFIEDIDSLEAVDDVYSVLELSNVTVAESDERITLLHGIDIEEHLSFYKDIEIEGDDLEKLDSLKEENAIIIHSTIAKKLDLNEGDQLKLEKNGSTETLDVVGIMETSIGQNGRYAIMEKDNLESLFTGYSRTALLRGDNIEEDVREELKSKNYILTTKSEETEALVESNTNFMLLLQGFIYMAVVVGIFGVINNLVISFLQRKHDIAVFRSIGMDKSQVRKMFVMEGLFSGILGSGLGVLLGIAILRMIPYIINAMDVPMKIEYPLDLILGHFIAGVIIILVSSSSLMVRSSGISIIEEIRYE
jgi:putative ABC transport system permease protein